MSNLYSALPSMDVLLKELEAEPAAATVPRAMLKDATDSFLDSMRRAIKNGTVEYADLKPEALAPRLLAHVLRETAPRFRRVLNGTGVVVHTNLGRSIMHQAAVDAVAQACRHYSNLEFDLTTGKRGSRYSLVEDILCRVSGAEAALVVNNNAAAVLLVLDTLAKDKEVVVSRGELVEIGGSFRIPEVMAKSGAILREVGATNRTHLHDYETVINENTGALMKVHASNFRMVGFTSDVSGSELSQLGRKHGLPVIEDLGSGNFYDFTHLGLGREPTVQETISQGLDVVTFSGDKVLGGPQAGIIVGKKEYIDRIKKNPMNRALRIDKMTLAGLEAVLRLYTDPEEARRHIPTLRMITAPLDELKKRARRLAGRINKNTNGRFRADTTTGVSRVGGGAFPERDLPTGLVRVHCDELGPDELKDRLLSTDPPLIGRIEEDVFCLDVRTLDDAEFGLVPKVLLQAAESLS